jgi:plastocyanin
VLAVVVIVAGLAVTPAFGGPTAQSSKTKSVSVRDDAFSPKRVSISRNGKVVWRWRGSNEHNVRFRKVPNGASKRGSKLQSSGRFARTFKSRGTYRYVCTIHEDLGMKGTVEVQ